MFDADGGGDEFLDTAVGDAALLSFALLILRLVVVSAVWMSGLPRLDSQDVVQFERFLMSRSSVPVQRLLLLPQLDSLLSATACDGSSSFGAIGFWGLPQRDWDGDLPISPKGEFL
ncbi:hypothetical protein RRG08_017269 [Elysia crispata]|uniref:Uncharacterized protein n=1 Tax=Elysia crispata TaxID=231223 RepID=A0AAE1CKC5_9GAST|nr:hypothetical protein RRG08_017269 [Elysia crispata]